MKTMSKICLLTCLLDLTDSQSLMITKTILSWKYLLITICPGTIPESLSKYEIQHHRIPLPTHNFDFNSNFLNTMGGLFQRARNSIIALIFLLKVRPDICFCIQPDSWLIALIGKLLLRNRVVVDLREIYEDRASAFPVVLQPFIRMFLRSIFRLLSRFTDEIIHVSEARQEYYSYLLKPGTVISPFPQLEYFPKNFSSRNGLEVQVVHAGSLRRTYASEQFVEAIPLVLAQAPNVQFVVIGGITPPLRNMRLIDELIGRNKLILIPRIPFEKVIDILLESDIGISLVLPLDQTHILAMPRKFFEYLAASLPVVAANVSTLRTFTETNNCGVLVDPCSPKSIADGILRLAFSQNLRRGFGENGRMSCEAKYNWENESKKLQSLLVKLGSG
jgi:glycosyltransferase involved in cell wall biosynthesis